MAIRFHYGDKSVVVENSNLDSMNREIDADFKRYLDSQPVKTLREHIRNTLAQSQENYRKIEELRNPKPVKKEGFINSLVSGFFG
jgi:hypothetical protein